MATTASANWRPWVLDAQVYLLNRADRGGDCPGPEAEAELGRKIHGQGGA